MKELVSIIMPAYNAAAHIAETIASVQAQTYTHWELIVVDDGSADDTSRVVTQLQMHDSRIRYVYQENARQGRARNNGIAHATGSYVAFLDSDDLWLPNKLDIQVPLLIDSKVDLLFSDAYTFCNHLKLNNIPVAQARMNTVRGFFSGDEGLRVFLASNRIPILTVLCRRASLESVGGFSENPLVQNAEDYHLWMKMLLEGCTLAGIDYTLAAYRQHSASVSDVDGQNLRQAVEAKIALSIAYPEKRILISESLQQTMLLSLEQVSNYPEAQFYATIDRYLQLSGKRGLRPLFVGFRRIRARALALKSIYFIFNYL